MCAAAAKTVFVLLARDKSVSSSSSSSSVFGGQQRWRQETKVFILLYFAFPFPIIFSFLTIEEALPGFNRRGH